MTEMIITVIICVGIILCFIIKKVMVLHRKGKKPGYILVPCSANTKNLEKTVRAYYWEEVFENENLAREILIVLMDKSENTYTAKRLSQEYTIVTTVDITGLEDYLKKREVHCRNK